MRVAILTCERCDDEWHVRDADDPRTTCRDCGGPLDVEYWEAA